MPPGASPFQASLLEAMSLQACLPSRNGIALLRVMRTMAPTRPRLAGGSAGLAAGAAAAAVYALHCPEMATPFLAVWYVLGVAIPALAGAFLGKLLLRW